MITEVPGKLNGIERKRQGHVTLPLFENISGQNGFRKVELA